MIHHADRGHRMLVSAGPIPALRDLEEVHVTSDCLDALIVGIFQRTVAPEHIGNLSDEEPQVGRLDPDVLEAEEWFPGRGVAAEDLLVQFERGKGHTSLYAP